MPEVIGAFAPRRREAPKTDGVCLREVHAEIFTLGGAIVFAVCMVLTVAALSASQLVAVTGLQQTILVILTIVSWFYFFDSITERLCLVDHSVEFRALLSRRRLIQLKDLDAMLLVYQGFNLDKGIESIEFRRRGKKPDHVALGPCWQHHKLEGFLRAVEEALHDPQLLDEVR
jgi:hypothetical protein